MKRWKLALAGAAAGGLLGIVGGYFFLEIGGASNGLSGHQADEALWIAYRDVFLFWPGIVIGFSLLGAGLAWFWPWQ